MTIIITEAGLQLS